MLDSLTSRVGERENNSRVSEMEHRTRVLSRVPDSGRSLICFCLLIFSLQWGDACRETWSAPCLCSRAGMSHPRFHVTAAWSKLSKQKLTNDVISGPKLAMLIEKTTTLLQRPSVGLGCRFFDPRRRLICEVLLLPQGNYGRE